MQIKEHFEVLINEQYLSAIITSLMKKHFILLQLHFHYIVIHYLFVHQHPVVGAHRKSYRF